MNHDDASPATAPAGFGPIFRSSPLLDALGGFHSRGSGATLEIGLLVGERHLNSRGSLHGGVVATLADTATGYLIAFGPNPPGRLVTVNLSVDYTSPAALGDWVEVRLGSVERTSRLVFASAGLHLGTQTIARARVMFSVSAGAVETPNTGRV